MGKNKVTLNDVAKAAGVSSSTVSRVLNHRSLVKSDTLKQIEDAMNSLGYIHKNTNTEADSHDNAAVIDESPLILLSIPSNNYQFYHEIISGTYEAARVHGYYLITSQLALDPDSDPVFCSLVRQMNVTGVIMLNNVSEKFLNEIQAICPVVQCCEHNDNTAFSYVGIDDYAAARNATDYLISCGCRKIAFLNGPLSYMYAQKRRLGFLDSIKTANLTIPENWIVSIGEIDYDMAFSTCYRLLSLENAPKAFFAVSDIFAIAAINAAEQFNLRVPEDIMVVGFDNLEVSRMAHPAITTVSQPRRQMGYSAFELLYNHILSPDTPTSIILNTELIVRNTTARFL
ncbi:LacI family DNA-binding transcriptional regulator [Murimonas intestini]|uniref:LacI family transcriptional regulator n=1 Tax=Murimonas intestini TaxID=1337051 RepID=A0AB73T0R6_9FIRM|nr:substrate-binding domain-containing protein [Murimonas intestini]MCR1840127.1 substrate-binding domain-containing protein [Murimonas intestini]MCR1867579.1 substrate-binding domain-containing protein [Murimonas intestini]MCR1885006.1 substrate-binding domain-containing protein [Murimonas intestini]